MNLKEELIINWWLGTAGANTKGREIKVFWIKIIEGNESF